MSALDIAFHLLNFLAPALVVGVALALATRVFMRKKPPALAITAQAAINSVAGIVALLCGLAYFGNDGKMVTYAGLVVACASSQWVMAKGWR